HMSQEGQAQDSKSSECCGAQGKPPVSQTGGQGASETVKTPADEMVKRRSRWQSSLAALRYVSNVSKDNEVKLRDTDRATSLWLLVVCILAVLCLVLPQFAQSAPGPLGWLFGFMAMQRMPLVLAADVLVGVALLMYVANRFGIVTTLTPRQALLTWQLMLGSSLLGIFLAVNLGAIISFVVANSARIVIPQ
ncbi:MAG: hypothetical protein HY711_01830, partial [Candidatus Melainabacteria bacterium]|nr:hypothetical protein [Candidatus Melainabacteria bacterium]